MKKFLGLPIEASVLFGIIAIAAALRFARITSLEFFTYDQARDAILVKRMIVDHQWRLLGTQTSMPGMFLPPFYYYTIAPILWIFRLNPIGVDIYAALIGVLTVPSIYFVANKIFGKPAGIFSAALISVSPVIVEVTRRAWNPNTLPFFILWAFYFLYRYFSQSDYKSFLLAFLFYGYCLSLHFGAWTLMPIFIFSWLYCFFKNRQPRALLLSFLIILFFISPLLAFEMRHRFFLVGQAKDFFLNQGHFGLGPLKMVESFLTALVALFTVLISGRAFIGQGAPLEFSGKISDLLTLPQPISVVAQRRFSFSIQWWGMLIFVMILIFSVIAVHRKSKQYLNRNSGLAMVWIWIFLGIFVSRFYRGGFFFFYFLYLFPAIFLLFGFLGGAVWKRKACRPLAIIVLAAIIGFHCKNTAVFEKTWRDINDLRSVATTISKNAPEDLAFNIATIRKDNEFWERNSVDYRYFVETFNGKRALDWYPEDYEKAKALFVVDETGNTDVVNSNVMEIVRFDPREIVGEWQLEKGIKIYKLSKK